MQLIDTVFLIVVVIFSAVVHEVMHGVAADSLGDKTARYAGRLTLNPIPHLDLFGSIILPLVLVLSGSSLFFAWAKPVPYNPFNLRSDGFFGRFSEAIVAFAGPLSNLVIAVITGIIIRLDAFSAQVVAILFIIVVVNVMLAIFNMFPIPPLDGSKVLSALLPRGMQRGYDAWRARLEMNPFIGMGIVLLAVILLGESFGGLVISLAQAIAGV